MKVQQAKKKKKKKNQFQKRYLSKLALSCFHADEAFGNLNLTILCD